MNIGGFSAAQVATSVWGNATRTLTSAAPTRSAIGGRPSIANNAILDLRPAANAFRNVVISQSSTLTAAAYGVYDGTNFDSAATAQTVWSAAGFGNSSQGFSAKNVSGGALNIAYSGYDTI